MGMLLVAWWACIAGFDGPFDSVRHCGVSHFDAAVEKLDALEPADMQRSARVLDDIKYNVVRSWCLLLLLRLDG